MRYRQTYSIQSGLSRELRKLSERRKKKGLVKPKSRIAYFSVNRTSGGGVDASETQANLNDGEIRIPNWLWARGRLNSCAPASPTRSPCQRKLKHHEWKLLEHCQGIEDNGELQLRRERNGDVSSAKTISEEKELDELERATLLLRRLSEENPKVEPDDVQMSDTSMSIPEAEAEATSEDEAIEVTEEVEEMVPYDDLLHEVIEAVQGRTIAWILKNLSSELRNMEIKKDEHMEAVALERQAILKSLEQAKKEQLELARREQLDEMFRLLTEVNEQSARALVDDLVTEGIERIANERAENYALELAVAVELAESPAKEKAERRKHFSEVAESVLRLMVRKCSQRLLQIQGGPVYNKEFDSVVNCIIDHANIEEGITLLFF